MARILYKLERRFGRFAIQTLLLYQEIPMFAVFICNIVAPDLYVSQYLYLDRDAVFRGEVWRLITFIFLPTSSSPIWIIFSLYFYFLIGKYLDEAWGSFKFNVYYLLGMICTIVSALIVGYADNGFLNLSLFFAFAVLFPDFEVRIFFIIPIKIKYLAYLDAAYYVVMLIIGTWSIRAEILASLVNFFIFFGGDIIKKIRSELYYRKTRANFRKNNWGR